MESNVGLWIDHREAVIVRITDATELTTRITSEIESAFRSGGGSPEYAADNRRDNRFKGQLQKYYDTVISCIRDARAILILGPGEAKTELQARLEAEALGGRVVGIEASRTMTERQLAARVRQHFTP